MTLNFNLHASKTWPISSWYLTPLMAWIASRESVSMHTMSSRLAHNPRQSLFYAYGLSFQNRYFPRKSHNSSLHETAIVVPQNHAAKEDKPCTTNASTLSFKHPTFGAFHLTLVNCLWVVAFCCCTILFASCLPSLLIVSCSNP